MNFLKIFYGFKFICLLSMYFIGIVAFGIPLKSLLKGAESKKELTEILFQALKKNDFNALTNYLPGEAELNLIKKTTNVNEKNLYSDLTFEMILEKTKENFHAIIENGVNKSINWETLELSEIKDKANVNQKNVYTIFLKIQDVNESGIYYSYDAIKIKNKWFLFQGIRIEEL